MNITNHMAVGAIIAISVKEPVLVLPAAFLSHLALDGLPHFGYYGRGIGDYLKHRRSHAMTTVDGIGLIFLFLIVEPGWLVYSAMFLAFSPDLIWAVRYLFFERKGKFKANEKQDPFSKLHAKIQWFERPVGFWVEITLMPILLSFIYYIQ